MLFSVLFFSKGSFGIYILFYPLPFGLPWNINQGLYLEHLLAFGQYLITILSQNQGWLWVRWRSDQWWELSSVLSPLVVYRRLGCEASFHSGGSCGGVSLTLTPLLCGGFNQGQQSSRCLHTSLWLNTLIGNHTDNTHTASPPSVKQVYEHP